MFLRMPPPKGVRPSVYEYACANTLSLYDGLLRNNFILEVHEVHNTRIYLFKTLTYLIIRLMFLYCYAMCIHVQNERKKA